MKNGLQYYGVNGTAYGLAVEHTLEDLTQWYGNHGTVIFYQSEYPYDVNNSYAMNGYVAYRVMNNVTSHIGYGIGGYSYWRDYNVNVNSVISCPTTTNGIKFIDSLCVWLTGQGSISHIINNDGKQCIGPNTNPQWLCNFP